LYNYEVISKEDLSFKVGDIITVIETKGEWWKGELNGKLGFFPANYVKVLDETQKNIELPKSTSTNSKTNLPPQQQQLDKDNGSNYDTEAPNFLAVAMFDFSGSKQQQEILFKFGDIIGLYLDACKESEDWWQGYVLCDESNDVKPGYFPQTYARKLTPDDFIYDSESGGYMYGPDITNWSFDHSSNQYVKNGEKRNSNIDDKPITTSTTSTSTTTTSTTSNNNGNNNTITSGDSGSKKERPQKPSPKPPSQTVSVSYRSHQRMSVMIANNKEIQSSNHMSLQVPKPTTNSNTNNSSNNNDNNNSNDSNNSNNNSNSNTLTVNNNNERKSTRPLKQPPPPTQ